MMSVGVVGGHWAVVSWQLAVGSWQLVVGSALLVEITRGTNPDLLIASICSETPNVKR
jgi:hypothetical protein